MAEELSMYEWRGRVMEMVEAAGFEEAPNGVAVVRASFPELAWEIELCWFSPAHVRKVFSGKTQAEAEAAFLAKYPPVIKELEEEESSLEDKDAEEAAQ